MFNKLLMYVTLFFIGTTALYFGIAKYNKYKLEVSRGEIKKLETESEIKDVVHEVKGFENNQSITFKIKKEIKNEEIPSSIGVHTIPTN